MSETSVPLVTVIIPAYNSEQYISEAIESVISQTYRNWETIVIDDGSSDCTVSKVQQHMNAREVRLIRQANAGPSKARNEGVKASRGKYCAFLDSDDIMMPDRLKLQVDAMEKNPDTGLVYSDLITFNKDGIVHTSKKEFIQPHSGNVLDKLLVENFITTSTVMVKRTCFGKAGYFDETKKHSEDYKMWLGIASVYKIGYLDIPLVKYRYHDQSLSKNRIVINSSSYGVIREFWNSNQNYRKKNKFLYKLSMSNQRLNLANAYCQHGKERESLKYVIEALREWPFMGKAYKIMLKNILQATGIVPSDAAKSGSHNGEAKSPVGRV